MDDQNSTVNSTPYDSPQVTTNNRNSDPIITGRLMPHLSPIIFNFSNQAMYDQFYNHFQKHPEKFRKALIEMSIEDFVFLNSKKNSKN